MQPSLISSVQSSHSVMSNSLWPRGLQHARLPCPSTIPGACSNSCPLRCWCHPTITSSVVPFSCLQSFPASRSFPKSQFFASGGQNIGVSASASVLPMNIQGWFPLGWTGWISLQSKELSRVFPTTPQFKSISSSKLSFLYGLILTSKHDYWKNHSFNRQTFVSKVMSLLFSKLSRLVIAFLPKSKGLSISWLHLPSAVIVQPPKIKSLTVSPTICHEMRWDQMPWS